MNDLVRLYDAEFPYAGVFQVHTARCRVALGAVPTDQPGLCEIRVEMRANNLGNTATPTEVRFQPFGVMVHAAMDDFDTALVDTAEGATTLSPLALALGQTVTQEKLRRVQRALDWAMAYRPTCHFSHSTGDAGWDDWSGGSGLAVATLALVPDGTQRVAISTDIWCTPEFAQNADMEVGVECLAQSGNTVRCVFTFTGSLGSASGTIDCTNADNGTEQSVSVSLSGVTNGGEAVTVQMSIQRTVGAATNNEVRTVRVQEEEIALLPAPLNE